MCGHRGDRTCSNCHGLQQPQHTDEPHQCSWAKRAILVKCRPGLSCRAPDPLLPQTCTLQTSLEQVPMWTWHTYTTDSLRIWTLVAPHAHSQEHLPQSGSAQFKSMHTCLAPSL